VLAQGAIYDFEFRLARGEMLQRNIALAGLIIGELEVALGERTAGDVFTGEANRSSFEHECSEGKRLGKAPVDGCAIRYFATPIKQPVQLRMKIEALGQSSAGLDHSRDRFLISGGGRNGLVH